MAEATVNGHTELTVGPMPVGAVNRRTAGWWGMVTLIVTEAFLFAYLLFSYSYFAIGAETTWLPAEPPSFRLSGPNTAILLASSLAVWYGERGMRQGSPLRLTFGLLVALVLGTAFVTIQYLEWMDKPFSLDTHAYGSLFFTVTGFHMAHVLVGLLVLAALTTWSILGYFDSRRMSPVRIGAMYWHFVDAVWVTVFFALYVTPYLR